MTERDAATGRPRTVWWRAPSDAQLSQLLAEQEANGRLSYNEVGATGGELPVGYHHDRWQVDLGADEGDRFERAAAALMDWVPQRGAGIRVVPDRGVHLHLTFALVLRVGPIFMVAPARVVAVVATEECRGFTYGTLGSHPECGEEAFAVRRSGGRVSFDIVAFSRPRHPLARLGAPVARLEQRRVTTRYLTAMQHAAR